MDLSGWDKGGPSATWGRAFAPNQRPVLSPSRPLPLVYFNGATIELRILCSVSVVLVNYDILKHSCIKEHRMDAPREMVINHLNQSAI